MNTTPTALRALPARSNTFFSLLFGRTVSTARWLFPAILLLGSGLSAFLLKAARPVAGASARQPVPALQGQSAVDYLKAHGLYDRLRDAAEEGTADRTKNPAQHPLASLSGEQMLPEPVQRRGRRHWQTGLKLRGARYDAQLNAVTASALRASGSRLGPLLTEVKKLTASDGALGDEYGIAVAVSGDTIVVGGYRNDNRRGAVYVYERNQGGAGNWGEVKKITASDAATSDVFGRSVAIQGDTIVAGAPLKNGLRGAAYIFERNQGGANNWGEVKKLTASDSSSSDLYGWSVALNGDTVVTGAHGTNNGKGAAYLYQRNQGGANNWGEIKKLTASDAANNDSFGVAVGISGDAVVAGASFDNSGTGSAYLFVRNQGGANNWGEVKKLTASDAPVSVDFGSAVSISGGTIAIGANATNSTTGAVYLYERNQGGPDNWGEIKKLTASDGEEGDAFGISVGISGDTVVAGAQGFASIRPAGGGPPPGPGAAYIFERNQGGADNWGQVRQLTASDGAGGDQFGAAVGISAGTVVVGAYDHNSSTGAAYTFASECGQWTEAQNPTASDAAGRDEFGFSVAVSGDTVVVGANRKDLVTGAVYIYIRNQGGAGNWGEVKKLTASDGAEFDNFGFSVGIDADTIVVGAQDKDNAIGAVYLFGRNQGGVNNWGQIKILTASDAAPGNYFGVSVGISGDQVVAGSSGNNNFTGAAYVFGRHQGGTNNWGEVRKVTASDPAEEDQFGRSVAISGDTVTVGAFHKDGFTGAAYVFGRNQGGADNWGQIKKLTASDAAEGDEFGMPVSVSGDTVVVGASANNSGIGAAYVFGRNQGGADNWGEIKKLTASDGVAGDRFGFWTGISGDTVVVGAIGKNSVTGAAYLFGRNLGGADNWGELQILTASDAAVNDEFGVSVAISGETLVIGAASKNSKTGAAYIFNTICTKGRAVKADFDGDGKTDLTVWRGNLFPAPWRILSSFDGSLQSVDWGTGQAAQNDEIVPGDYDGDGKTDVAVFRRSNGHWYIQRSSDGGITDEFWGLGTDEPAPGDYDGDGKTDVAVFRASANSWYIKQSSNGLTKSEVWGTVGDTPVPGDYDGDGKTDVAVWRGAVGGWYIKQSSDGMIKSETWGTSAAPHFDVPVPADYDGDGKYDIAVWRGAMTNWYILKSSNGQTQSVSWGTSAAPYFDVPVPGDYDGDGKADVAVWRPLDGNWLVIRSSNGTNLIQQHGQSGDTPVVAKGVR